MLHINQDSYSGFELTFTNGWKVSIQFGPNTLSDNQHNTGYNDSTTAEIRAWDNNNIPYVFERTGEPFLGNVPTDKVSDFISYIREQESN